MCFQQQLMIHFIQNLSLNFHSFPGLYLNGTSSSVDSNHWYRISTSYCVKNLQLSSCLSIKSTYEFKRYTKTSWHNGMKMLGKQIPGPQKHLIWYILISQKRVYLENVVFLFPLVIW